MTYELISSRAVTLSLRPEERMSPAEAAQAVRRALRVCGYAPWPRMDISLYPARAGALLVASPAGPEIHIAPYALPILQEYFTE